MNEEKILTKEIAEQFLAVPSSVNLDEFTALDDDGAEVLATHEGDLLLDGLTTLSDACAKSLSTHDGFLSLTSLTELSDEGAAFLHKHDHLWFDFDDDNSSDVIGKIGKATLLDEDAVFYKFEDWLAGGTKPTPYTLGELFEGKKPAAPEDSDPPPKREDASDEGSGGNDK